MNKTAVLFLMHMLAWVFVFFLGLIIVYNSIPFTKNTNLIVISVLFSVWLLVSFYAFYYKLIPDYLAKKSYKKFAIYSMLIVFVIIPIDQLLSWGIFYFSSFPRQDFSFSDVPIQNLIYPYLGSIIGSVFAGVLGTFYRFGVDWFHNQQVKKDLENKHLLSELKTLKSKLNPHVLFNTLNNIDALIQTNPDQASTALAKLSDILRYVVYETAHEKVSMAKEIAILQKYIALEKIRIVHPEAVTFTSKVSSETMIPPMLFFPFIENGFKHSNLNNPEHTLKISIIEANQKIVFRCSNTINTHQQNEASSGVGLALAKKRLHLLYPTTHMLIIDEMHNEFRVHLEIQID